jgi:hypothetical protein
MSREGPGDEVPHSALPGDQGARLQAGDFLGSESEIEGSSAKQNFALWIAVLGSAVVWFIQLQTTYALVPWVCSSGKLWALHVVSVLFVVLAAVPGGIGWSQWRACAKRKTERESAGDGRRRFMAMLGLMLTALFVILIIAQAMPSFFFDPCLD